ncbi:MAG: hypothetical protein JNK82_43610 [Myxococcaceae bacterium]|nr:hypothetical protein [Myxococcaceae bacterium]
MPSSSSLTAVLLLLACGATPKVTDGGSVSPGTTQPELQAFAESGAYTGWKAEPAAHTSAGPHGEVRTFVNDTLYTSMKAGNTTHPNGSVAVKELYSGGSISGWAVDVKRDDGQWVFYEGFKPALNQYYFVGGGNLCANCHQGGVDFVLLLASALP